jgi:urease accessory protein
MSASPAPSPSKGEGAEQESSGAVRSADPIVITSAQVEADGAELAGLEREALVLTAEERRWGRRRVATRGGRELALALPTGSTLVPGAVLHVAPGWYVVVEAALEPVLAATPRSPEEALHLAFEVGNRHFPLAIDAGRLLVPDDPAMEQLLTRLGVAWRRERAAFTPIGTGHRHGA